MAISNSHSKEQIFNSAVELTKDDDRDVYLKQACGENRKLRAEIDELLKHDRAAGSFLEEPAILAQTVAIAAITEKPGDQIGHYKLLEQIGEGGMGIVYMAQQTEPVKRRVALKIIKPGMDTKQVVARFEAERQALALMDHANIAKVYDGGATEAPLSPVNTTTGRGAGAEGKEETPPLSLGRGAGGEGKEVSVAGRPYFVMELVRGIPITEYCDKQKLTTTERLKLFITVCKAVQHAHQKGIIHRDIKPSNILVSVDDGVAVPKVIDFGVAKAINQELTEQTLFTNFATMIGTPLYMSPEQAEMTNLDIDTRSDIYSLGVLLYELLTGSTPFEREKLKEAGYDEIRRIIREEEPPNPSARISTLGAKLTTVSEQRNTDSRTLSHTVQGDLDWIVMKALEKDRSRRYETANAMVDDVERYLNDEPVLASPPSALYRFSKFAKRNRGFLIAASVVAMALVLGMAGTGWQAILATRAQEEAKLSEEEASRQRDIALTQQQKAEREAAIAKAVNEFLNNDLLGKADPHDEPDRDLKVTEVLDRAIRSLEGRFVDQPLVEAEIRTTIGRALVNLARYEEAKQQFNTAKQLVIVEFGIDDRKTILMEIRLLWIAHDLGQYKQTLVQWEKLLERCRKLLGSDDWITQATKWRLADIKRHLGHYDDAEQMFRQMLVTHKRVRDPERITLSSILDGLARTMFGRGRYSEAEKLLREELEIRKRDDGPEHRRTLAVMAYLGEMIYNLGRHDEGEKLIREVFEIRKRVSGPEHPKTLASMKSVAAAVSNRERFAEAEKLYRELLEIEKRVLGSEDPRTLANMSLLSRVICMRGRFAEAEVRIREVLEIQKRVLGPEHLQTLWSMNWLGGVIEQQGRYAEAEKLNRELLEIRKRTLGPEHPMTLDLRLGVANAIEQQGRYAEGEKLRREVIEIQERMLGPEHRSTLQTKGSLSRAILRQGRYAEVEKHLRNLLEIGKRVLGPENLAILNWMNNLAYAIGRQGRHKEAEKLYRETIEIMKRVPGSEHPSTLNSMTNLAETIGEQDRFDEAEKLIRQVIEIQKRVQGPDHPKSLKSKTVMADVISRQGRYVEAEKLHREVIEIRTRVLSPKHPDTLHSIVGLANDLLKLKRLEECESLIADAVKQLKKDLGMKHPLTVKAMTTWESVLRQQGQIEKADEVYQELLSIEKQKKD